MIVPNNKYGLSFRGFSDQEASSLNKRLQPADPIEFLKWISQTLRDHRLTLENLSGKHRSLITKQSNATRALKNLDKLVSFAQLIENKLGARMSSLSLLKIP